MVLIKAGKCFAAWIANCFQGQLVSGICVLGTVSDDFQEQSGNGGGRLLPIRPESNVRLIGE